MQEKYLYLGIRILVIIIALLLLSFSIDINERRRRNKNKPLTSIYYILFVAGFSIFTAVLEFLRSTLSFLGSPLLPLVNDILNLIFTFSASISLVSITGFHSCLNTEYVKSTRAFSGSKGLCREFQSLTYLLLILFYVYIISSIISGFYFGKKAEMVHCLKPRRQRKIDILFEDGEASGTDETSYSELSESNDGIITDDDDTEDENVILSSETFSCNGSTEEFDKHDFNSKKHNILLTYSTKNFKRRQRHSESMSSVLDSKSVLPMEKSANNSTMFNSTSNDFFKKKVKIIQKEFKKKKDKKKVIQNKNKDYQDILKTDPTFVPYIGSFFMHDRRRNRNFSLSHKMSQNYRDNYSCQRNKWKNSHRKSLQDDVWTHDAFEMHEDINIKLSNKKHDSNISNTRRGSEKILKHTSRIFNIRVKIPTSNVTRNFKKELTNHFNPLFHRFLLREDKPVKIKFPNKLLKIVYPAPERSFKFVPRNMQAHSSFNNMSSVEVSNASSFMISRTNSETSAHNPILNKSSFNNQPELHSYLKLKDFSTLHSHSKNTINNSLNFHTHNKHSSLTFDTYKAEPTKVLNFDSRVFPQLSSSIENTLKLTNKINTQQVFNENGSEICLSNSAIYPVPFQSDYQTSQQPLLYYFSTHLGHSYFTSYYNIPSQYNTPVSSLPSIPASSSNISSITQDNNAMIYYYDPMQYYYSYSAISAASNYVPNRSESVHFNHVSTKFPINSTVSHNSHRNNSSNEQGICYYPQGYTYYTNEVTM
ncbi:hypothetical protein PMAC_001502 [Pneumocystis sp. 'macacae']|nr:hypothetical protein PMAC_001502 [Pneumocystis sp. 'macacae']